MLHLQAVLEKTRKEIIAAADPSFIRHKARTKDLPNAGGAHYEELNKVQVGNYKQYEAVFHTDSRTFPGEDYTEKIILLDLNGLIRSKKSDLTLLDKVRYAINEGDLLVGCTCPAFCLHEDTKIKLIDKKEYSIKELKDKFEAGEKLIVYSTDINGNFKPGVVNSVWISGRTKEMIKITLDNGKEVTTTCNHEYMLRDGTYKQAANIVVGESLMPIYFNEDKGYETFLPNQGSFRRFKAVHNAIALEFLFDEYNRKYVELVETGKEKFLVVHHKDFNKENNNPNNLCWMGDREHKSFHAKIWEGNRDKVIQGTMDYHDNPKNFDKISSDRVAAGKACHIKHPELAAQFNRSGVLAAKSIKGREISSENFKATWKLKRKHMIEQAIISGKARCFEQAKIMQERARKLFLDPEYKKQVITRLTEYNKDNNVMFDKDGILLMCIGRVMGIMAEAAFVYGEITPGSYDAVAETKDKNFRWDHYFRNIEDAEFWFYAAFSGNSSINTKNEYRRAMLDECREFSKIRIKKCIRCGKDFVGKKRGQILCSKECKQVHFAHSKNHKVIKVEKVVFDEEKPVYDISVEKYNNFYVSAGVVLHNCYWGYAYIDTKLKIVHPEFKEKRPPDIRNPQRRGIICKHLHLTLQVLPFVSASITKDLKEQLGK